MPAYERVWRLESELAVAHEKCARQESELAELRQHGIARERELRRLVAQSATAGDLAARLQASERIRRAQTLEMLNHQQMIAELEGMRLERPLNPETQAYELAPRPAEDEP